MQKTDVDTESALRAKEAFFALVNTAPENIRQEVEAIAWGNEWTVETYDASKTNEQRWIDCKNCADLIIDAPADYGLTI
jgi:hypothetical protein